MGTCESRSQNPAARWSAGVPGMLPVLPAAVVQDSPGALGVAGLPPQDPLQAPRGRALRGVDERPAEVQQAGEAGRTEGVRVASSLPAPRGMAEGGTCLQTKAPLTKPSFLLPATSWGLLHKGSLARRAGREAGRWPYLGKGSPSAGDQACPGSLPSGGLGCDQPGRPVLTTSS